MRLTQELGDQPQAESMAELVVALHSLLRADGAWQAARKSSAAEQAMVAGV